MSPGMIIRLLRTAEGFSQAALAEKLDVSKSYLCQVERERRSPGLPFLRDVAKLFRVPLPLLVLDETDSDSAVFADLRGILSRILATRIETARTGKKGSRPAPKKHAPRLAGSRSTRAFDSHPVNALPVETR